jgi:hypothetical protein
LVERQKQPGFIRQNETTQMLENAVSAHASQLVLTIEEKALDALLIDF